MLDLAVLPGDYAICRLPAGSPFPAGLIEAAAAGPDVISVTWTPSEISIICAADQAPAGGVVNVPWRCLRVNGPVNLALTGILASLVNPLADARVNIFAFSTFDTDYLLVKAEDLPQAVAALRAAGHTVEGVTT